MKILVVGGAGYIGSHMIKRFQSTDHQIEVLDNLSTGFEENSQNYKLHICDLSNKDEVHKILKNNKYDIIMHFASSINVGESYDHPIKYYENNVINTLNLLECMIDLKILNFIFSSTFIFNSGVEQALGSWLNIEERGSFKFSIISNSLKAE